MHTRMIYRSRIFFSTLLVAIGVVAISLLSGCSIQSNWNEFRGAGGRGYTADNIRPPIGIKWKLQLQTDGKQAFAFNNFVIRDNVMYFGSTDGNFYALDLETGYMRWVFKTGAPVNSIPFADEHNVYFGSNDGKVYSVSRDDGKELWEYNAGRPIQSTVIRYQNHIIAASDGGSLFFLSLDGKLTNEIANPVWYRDTFQVYDDIIYLARGPVEQARSLGAYDLKTHNYHWLLDAQVLDADWYSFPAISGNRLFISTLTAYQGYWQFDYYAFQRMSGQMLWHWSDFADWGKDQPTDLYNEYLRNMNILDYMAPAVWKNRVIYSTGDTMVRALDARTGSVAWSHRFPYRTTSAAVVAGDRVYLGIGGSDSSYATPPPDASGQLPGQSGDSGSNPPDLHGGTLPGTGGGGTNGPPSSGMPATNIGYGMTVAESGTATQPKLVCLSARNGRIIWQMNIDGELLSPPVIAGKWIVFGTDKNYVYVLEELV